MAAGAHLKRKSAGGADRGRADPLWLGSRATHQTSAHHRAQQPRSSPSTYIQQSHQMRAYQAYCVCRPTRVAGQPAAKQGRFRRARSSRFCTQHSHSTTFHEGDTCARKLNGWSVRSIGVEDAVTNTHCVFIPSLPAHTCVKTAGFNGLHAAPRERRASRQHCGSKYMVSDHSDLRGWTGARANAWSMPCRRGTFDLLHRHLREVRGWT